MVPFGSLSGLHLPSFSTNLVSTAALSDAMVNTTTPGGQRVSICTCTRPLAAPCSCRLLSHQTLQWHHRLGCPSLPHLRDMHSRLLISGHPRSLPPLPPSPAPPCLSCVEGRQRAAPHSSSFPPTTAPLQRLWTLLGADPGGAESEGAESGGAEPGGAEPGGTEPEGVEPGGAESEGAESGGAEPRGAEPRGTASAGGPAGASPRLSPRREPLSPQQLCE
ncbi:unnamed protein product [Closterium sp. NIES-54]